VTQPDRRRRTTRQVLRRVVIDATLYDARTDVTPLFATVDIVPGRVYVTFTGGRDNYTPRNSRQIYAWAF